jgi:AraC-like DNA-binding protein
MKSNEQLAYHLFAILHTHIYMYTDDIQMIAYFDDTMPRDLRSFIEDNILSFFEKRASIKTHIAIQKIQAYDVSFLMIKDHHDTWIMGPFLEQTPSTKAINALIVLLKSNAQIADFIQRFYDHLPVLESSAIRFIQRLIQTYQAYEENEEITTMKTMKSKKAVSTETIEEREAYQLLIKRNYEIEDQLMHAVKHGDLLALKQVFKGMRQFYLPDRVPFDTLRNRKNNMIILNTLSTRRAIEGGLDIYHAHQISTLNALRIEQITSSLEVDQMTQSILSSFIEAVHLYQTKGYPHLVKETMLYIYQNITRPLTLEDISHHLFVTPEHLSRMIKKYTKKTVHAIMMETKVDEAKKMIAQQELSMIDIAHILGFSSSSHFSTIFKKYAGLSPKSYQLELMKR